MSQVLVQPSGLGWTLGGRLVGTGWDLARVLPVCQPAGPGMLPLHQVIQGSLLLLVLS